MLRPGDAFDRYTIEAFIGEGGMGRVYRALDTRLHRKVALKILGVEAGASAATRSEGIARLLREARAAAALEHPNTVAIHDVGELDGIPYIAMELISGRTLRPCIGETGIPFEMRLRWLLDVARALAAAHKVGLVHRDVKPENVMVRDDGVVKVLDFGVARRISEAVDAEGPTHMGNIPTLTGKGVVVGTPVYMAPEQMHGGPVDGRADQFGWGVLAFELLSGQRPWKDKADMLAMVASILTEPPQSLRTSTPDVNALVERIILKVLRRDPVRRFATMDELIRALEPHVSSASSTSLPPHTEAVAPESFDHHTTRRALAASAPPKPAHAVVRRSRVIFAGLALLVAASGFALWRRTRPRVLANPTVATSTPKETPPVSAIPGAVAAYNDGMQALWDGAHATSMRHFESAVTRDPALSAAHLRFCLGTFATDPSPAREHYQRAFQHRASLSPKDLALLEATEPLMREPTDLVELEKRLTAAVNNFPTDPELLYHLGAARQERNNFEGASEAFQRATHADPHFALAWWSGGEVEYVKGDVNAALLSYDECLRMAPGATICLHERARVFRREGDCARMEQEAKAAIVKEQDSALGYYYLAESLYSRGRPIETVREALRAFVARLPPNERQDRDLYYQSSLAKLSGDFGSAERFAREKEQFIAELNERAEHFNVAALLVDTFVESGRNDRAAKVAQDYLNKQDVWLGFTNSLFFYNVQLRAGTLGYPAFEQHRAEWLATEDDDIKRRGAGSKGQAREHGFSWIDGYADFVETREEALAALGMLPVYLPLPGSTRRNVGRELAVGKVYALAGRPDEALPFLKRATQHCGALDYPSPHTRAHFYLGLAYEAKGQKEEACTAYGVVLARWGAAKPSSVTAEKTKVRVKALGCK